MKSAKYFAYSLLLLLGLLVETTTRFQAQANPGAFAASASAPRSSAELDVVLSMVKSGKYGRSVLSAVNDYLCKRVRSESTKDNLNELIKLGKQLDKVKNTRTKLMTIFLNKFNVIVELIVRSKTEDKLCIQEGQSATQAAALEMIYHAKLMNYPQISESSKQCNRIPNLIEYFDQKRKEICEHDGYFVHSLAKSYDTLDSSTQRKLTGSLSELMDFLMNNLGGYNTKNCKRKLSNEIETIENFDQEAGTLLLDGLKLVVDDDRLDKMKQDSVVDDTKFLNDFVQIRNENLLKPCKIYMDQVRDPIKQIRLYESLFGSYQQVEFTSSQQDDRRFHRAWALYNTCELLNEKLPRLSVALLRAMNFDVESSKLDKTEMVMILKSTE